MCAMWIPHEEAGEIMKNLKRMLAAVAMVCIVSAGAFAQKGKGDEPKRPPKNPDNRVVVKEKPAPNNNRNQGNNRGDSNKRGKP